MNDEKLIELGREAIRLVQAWDKLGPANEGVRLLARKPLSERIGYELEQSRVQFECVLAEMSVVRLATEIMEAEKCATP